MNRSWVPAVLMVSLAGAGLAFGAGSADLTRSFQLTYEVRLPAIPSGAKEVRVWIPLAASDRYQKIKRRIIEVPYPYRVTKDKTYGNDILFLTLKQPLPPTLDLSVRYEAVVRGERSALEKAAPSISSSVRKGMGLHLSGNQLMAINDESSNRRS